VADFGGAPYETYVKQNILLSQNCPNPSLYLPKCFTPRQGTYLNWMGRNPIDLYHWSVGFDRIATKPDFWSLRSRRNFKPQGRGVETNRAQRRSNLRFAKSVWIQKFNLRFAKSIHKYILRIANWIYNSQTNCELNLWFPKSICKYILWIINWIYDSQNRFTNIFCELRIELTILPIHKYILRIWIMDWIYDSQFNSQI